MIRFFIRLLNYSLLVCFLGSLWGGWYVSKQGFGRKWRKKLSEEFAKRGVEMTARRLTLDPLRGLVASDVRVFRDSLHQETVAVIDEVRLDINYTRLLRKEPFLDAITLSEAEVMFDVDPRRANSGEFTVHHLAAQLYFQQDKWEIRRLQGQALGVVFSISGVVEHPMDWQAAPNATNPSSPANVWQPLQAIPRDWLQELTEVRFPKKLGRLDLTFRGNIAQKRWLQSFDAKLDMPQLHWRGILCENISLEADLADHLVTLRQLNWRDDHGPMAISGTWRPGSQGHLLVDSHVNAPAIFQEIKLFPGLSSVTKMLLKGDISWTEGKRTDWQIVGKLDATDLIYRSVKWDHAQTQFSVAPGRWLVRDVNLQQKNGTLTGQCLSDHDQLTVEMTSTVNPLALWLSSGKDLPPWIEDFDFAVNPWLQLKISSQSPAPENWQADGEIVFGRTNFRGVALTSAQAHFSCLGHNLALSQVQITRPEGQCTGEAFWNGQSGELALWDVKNSIDLVAFGLWADRNLADAMETIRLPKGTVLEGAGRVNWKNDQLAAVHLQVHTAELAIFELPAFSGLAKNMQGNALPSLFQASVSLQDDLLRVDPFTAQNDAWQFGGQATWNLVSRQFTGQLERKTASEGYATENTAWSAESPWQQIVWKKGETIINP